MEIDVLLFPTWLFDINQLKNVCQPSECGMIFHCSFKLPLPNS